MAKGLQVPTKHIQRTHVDGENAQVFKDLMVTTDKHVLDSNFYVLDIDNVDIILGYP